MIGVGVIAGIAAVMIVAAPAQAADFPCRTAKLIVPWGAGGGTGVIFRLVIETINKTGISPQLQMVNISGQGGNKGAKVARKAKADGCTLFAIHQSAVSSYLTGRVNFTWDAFESVAMLTRTAPIIGANKNVPWKDARELVAAAKAAPGTILTGGTLGSTSHFWFLLLEDATGIKLKHVSYDGTRQRMTALLANNISIGEINLASAVKYLQAGDLKALGSYTEKRDPLISNVPTMREQGIDLVAGTDRGVSAPKGTPKELVAFWGKAFEKAANDPALIAALAKKGTSVHFKGPAAATAYWNATFTKWKAIATKIGMYKGK
ncbi:MAG: tripartite tricarboxylate transporter substrate binding protein [Rhodospirillales bacterium]|nr:tripartite tricarboxylate transporter substrate binding protein [Rhodospirillales bacterium]